MEIPFVSKEKMEEVDNLMIDFFKVGVSKLMEYAGYNSALLAKKFIKKKCLVICGKGNNGGDGLCCARHLHNFGFDVDVFLVENNLKDEPLVQLEIIKNIGVNIVDSLSDDYGLIIDAILGYSLKGNPSGKYKDAIDFINKSKAYVLSIDVPSGYNIDEEKKMQPCVNADSVVCIALPKKGLDKFNWDIYVADLGVPRKAYDMVGLEIKDVFKENNIIKIE